ncbi:immunoglobulin-like domain-containing protein [Enterococcus ureasiticus]|uniref:Sortase n=1 Tax=Enterococcus ureasiticus TaxID=903984 RepID=A0A1E5GNZ2_9ENTE|nr:immunoglobulin-like domain-containing protein [Enterococcus ureasiticus]OEG14426.1 sortase [Enterococcus ureasiticus]
MKKNTIKHTIIIGFISILGIALFIVGYIFTDKLSRANSLASEPKKEKVTLVKNIPTGKELTKLATNPKKKQSKEKFVAVNTTKDTTAPIINVPEETVEQNAQVNIYENITATDNKDGDVTVKVTADEALDTSVVGTQTIHFTATDTSGNIGTADRTFHIIPKSEPVAAPAAAEPTPAQQTPVEPAQAAPVSIPETPAEPANSAMTITMNGQTIPYQNGGQGSGQSIIDSNPSGVASTWGGAAVQSGDDGQNTHFIGHNPGAFSTVFSLGAGSQIVVTDANGTPSTYTVRTLLQLDDYGTEVGTGTNYWDLTVGTGGGERITLQSCVNDDINLFVIAYK